MRASILGDKRLRLYASPEEAPSGTWLVTRAGKRLVFRPHQTNKAGNIVQWRQADDRFQMNISCKLLGMEPKGIYKAEEVKYDSSVGEDKTWSVELPDSFFTKINTVIPKRRINNSLSGFEINEAEKAIKTLNTLVDKGILEVALREGKVLAVARVKLGG